MTDASHDIILKLPAATEELLIARMTISGLGMLAGLDADMIGDLRTVTNECCDCLIHQPVVPQFIVLEGAVRDKRLMISFTAEGASGAGGDETLDMDVVRGVLETLMPQVTLSSGEHGVNRIQCSMPV